MSAITRVLWSKRPLLTEAKNYEKQREYALEDFVNRNLVRTDYQASPVGAAVRKKWSV